ncbi:MAG: NAD kinase [Prevotella sp.]|nr:NAD kinase [Prevotella sp.]
MAQRILRFALFGNIYQAKKSVSIQKILSFLSERKAEIYIEKDFYEFLTRGQHLEVKANRIFEGRDFDADFVISMGGDGTLLKAAHYVGDKNIPIMGVNMGRLGFLADVGPGDIERALKALYAGDFILEDHAVIQVDAEGKTFETCPCALNDIAVLKRDNASMISIRTNVNGEYLVTYQADGLIVSTPTGSTAYSLSNGGPIIVPESDILCLTPVAPHSLNIRPIVVRDDAVISITVESRSHNFLIAIDGRSEKCDEGTRLTIRKAPYSIRIVKRNGHKYFTTLREKMTWGLDNRG